MNQAEVHKLIHALRLKVSPRANNVRTRFQPRAPSGALAQGGNRYQLELTRRAVTGLIQHERLELSAGIGITAREYTERLIGEAVLHGDTHVATMRQAEWWLAEDPALVHKLFKVLAARPAIRDSPHGYTRLLHSPSQAYSNKEGGRQDISYSWRPRVVVELLGNPFPPLQYSNTQSNRGMIHNVLLTEARREQRLRSQAEQTQDSEVD